MQQRAQGGQSQTQQPGQYPGAQPVRGGILTLITAFGFTELHVLVDHLH